MKRKRKDLKLFAQPIRKRWVDRGTGSAFRV